MSDNEHDNQEESGGPPPLTASGPPPLDGGPPPLEAAGDGPPPLGDGPPALDDGPPALEAADAGPPALDDGPPALDDGPPALEASGDAPPAIEAADDGPPTLDEPDDATVVMQAFVPEEEATAEADEEGPEETLEAAEEEASEEALEAAEEEASEEALETAEEETSEEAIETAADPNATVAMASFELEEAMAAADEEAEEPSVEAAEETVEAEEDSDATAAMAAFEPESYASESQEAAPAAPQPSQEGAYRVLGQAVNGAGLGDELALIFAEKARETAQTFVDKRNTEEALEETQQAIARFKAAVTESEQGLGALKSALSDAEAMEALPVAAKALYGLAGAGVLLAGIADPALGGVLLVLAGAAGFVLHNKAKKARDAAVSEADGNLDAAKSQLKKQKAELESAKSDAAGLQEKLDGLKPTKTIDTVGRVHYPIRTVDLAGYSLVLDRMGAHEAVELKIPDLATNPEVVKSVQETVGRTKELPTLLQPSAETGNEVDSLHGRELDLKGAVDDFTDMVHSIPIYNRGLPLVPGESKLSALVADPEMVHGVDQIEGPVLTSPNVGEMDKAIGELSDVAERLREVGGHADAVLRESYSDLNTNLVAYKEHRSHALNCIHSKFLDAMERSSLLSVNTYCPPCNRVPQWLYRKLGVPLEEAHTVNQRELLTRMNEEPEVAKRLANDESLVREMNSVFRNLSILCEQIPADHAATEDEDDVGADLAEHQAHLARMRAMQNQVSVVLEEYRAIIRKIMTGSARPILELSREAKLHLDPVQGTWSCGACEKVFDDEEEIALGRLLKVKDNLMLPIWNHLWTEKDDFRKSELFRTNESLQRMGEKETEKLLSVAESYKSDMRPVRENLIRYSTEAETKHRQLTDTIQGLQDMGYMTKEKAKQVHARIRQGMGGAIGEATKQAEAKELLLSLEPQSQLARRPAAADPIQMLLTPETLFLENELLEHGMMLPGTSQEDPALSGQEDDALGIPSPEAVGENASGDAESLSPEGA